MKKTFTLLITLIMILCAFNLSARDPENKRPVEPLKTPNPTLYATDIYLNNLPAQNQRNATLCIAFNGWMYAAYSYYDSGSGYSYWQIMKSEDQGETWTAFSSASLQGIYHSLDIEVTGNTVADLVVYLARVYEDATLSYLRVSKYNGSTAAGLGNLVAETVTLPDHYNDISIATDYKFPAYGATPFTVAIAFSKTTAATDYVSYKVSGDGGNSITDQFDIISTGQYSRDVSISYGRSSSMSNGRYFVAWEQLTSSSAPEGSIYVAHTTTYYNSTFSTPFRLDDIIGSAENYCLEPVMCTQFNNTDNVPEGHFTAIVMVTRDFNGSGTDYDVITMYNKDPTNTENWIRMDVANSVENDRQGDINFDPSYNNFLVTWFQETAQLLPYWVQGQDIPGSWIVINTGYNNDANLANPYPKVEIHPVFTQVGHVWIGERGGGNGAAMFDAEWSTVGIPPVSTAPNTLDLKVYPNPSNTITNITFTLKEAGHVSIGLFNMYGQTVATVTDANMTAGEHTLILDVSSLPAGCYHYNFLCGSVKSSGKIVVTH